ncbi:MAG TPA: hypothetical protein V6C72_19735 [Chroococcales cyanobacterium]
MSKSSTLKRRQNGHTIAELSLVLMIVFFFFVLPAIDLIGVATGVATGLFLTYQVAARAANQSDFSSTLQAMVQEATNDQNTGFAHFAKLVPTGGYQASGVDLYVVATNYRSGAVDTIGPNVEPSFSQVDTSDYLYEIEVKSNYDIGPLVSMSSFPFLRKVPGIGIPFHISYSTTRNVEHAQSLKKPPKDQGAGVGVANFDRTVTDSVPGANNGMEMSGWNYPQIYQQIAAAGQKIVAENVIIVNGTDNWISTGINVSPGETLWIDSRADGDWSTSPTQTLFDATGVIGTDQNRVLSTAQIGSLIGAVGTPPVTAVASGGTTSPNLFAVGKTLTMYPVAGTGVVSMMINDDYRSDNSGQQFVRVIATE